MSKINLAFPYVFLHKQLYICNDTFGESPLLASQYFGRSRGRPNAAGAIGNAVGSNPISFIIPCHRIIRESGELGGYRWGLERKTAILGWEASYQD